MYRIMNVRNFRAEFTTLTEPVMVISREKVVGTWQPRGMEGAPEHIAAVDDLIADLVQRTEPVVPAIVPTRKAQQANRDAILRKINRGG